jgi:hypothetical protein
MRKFTIPVSGARVGDTARPIPSKIQVPVRTKQLGLRVHTTPIVATTTIAPEDYASLDDYETGSNR